jgi:rRNA small subunit pseudouridine methyltransferase Nep1
MTGVTKQALDVAQGGIPPQKKQKVEFAHPKEESRMEGNKVYVVLERAGLESVKTKRGYQLAQADEHKKILSKHKRDISAYRPDIVHQCLLALLDSPLCKSGHLFIYIHTINNVLIEVNPQLRLPRTFARFCKLFVQLLHKYKIKAVNNRARLLKVVKNPITMHLPRDAPIYGTSVTAPLVSLPNWIPKTLEEDKPVVFVVGSHAHGKIDADYIQEWIGYSEFKLSGATAISKLTNAFEHYWKIL